LQGLSAADDFSGLEGGGEFWVVFDEEGKTGVETLTGDIQFSPDAVKANSIRRGTGEQSKPKQSDPPPALTPKARLELRLVGSGPGPGLSEMRDLGPSQSVFVSNIPVITNADIAYARATRYADAPAVEITFTKTGEIKFCDITSANIGKSMAVLVDGKLVNVATIRERFCGGTGGKAIITGNFSIEEAKQIAATFPDGPADAVKVNSVWQGTGYQSKPALSYPMILFVKRRWGEDFEGVTWYPTLENGLINVTGRIDANGVVAFSEDKVIYGEATDQRQGMLAGAKYTAKLDKMTLQGNGDWTDPKTKEVVKLTFFLELAK
jgi:hypothetical protein